MRPSNNESSIKISLLVKCFMESAPPEIEYSRLNGSQVTNVTEASIASILNTYNKNQMYYEVLDSVKVVVVAAAPHYCILNIRTDKHLKRMAAISSLRSWISCSWQRRNYPTTFLIHKAFMFTQYIWWWRHNKAFSIPATDKCLNMMAAVSCISCPQRNLFTQYVWSWWHIYLGWGLGFGAHDCNGVTLLHSQHLRPTWYMMDDVRCQVWGL